MNKASLIPSFFASMAALVFLQGASTQAAPQSVAILGDSLSTGAGTHPALQFDGRLLWEVFQGNTDMRPDAVHVNNAAAYHLANPLVPPQRLWASSREFRSAIEWAFRSLVHGVSQVYLDTEEYSWGYLTARALGVEPAQVWIAAENGARVFAAARQVDRVLDAGGGKLPDVILLFFSGNDTCAPSLDAMTTPEDFTEQLTRALSAITRNGEPAEGGTTVYVMGYIGILQLINSESILERPVKAFGRETTCRKMREDYHLPPKDLKPESYGPPEAWYFSQVMPPNPSLLCPSVLAPTVDLADRVTALANRTRAFRGSAAQAVEVSAKMAKEQFPEKKLSFRYLEGSAKVVFEGKDIADDCFHLSIAGQQKIADAVLGELRISENGRP